MITFECLLTEMLFMEYRCLIFMMIVFELGRSSFELYDAFQSVSMVVLQRSTPRTMMPILFGCDGHM